MDFGFKKVSETEKTKLVNGVFSQVASRYDLMNDLMSFGVHRYWKSKLLKEISLFDGAKIVDVACGTGDISLALAKKTDAQINIDAVDPNSSMLEIAKLRSIDQNLFKKLNFTCAGAEKLPFPDHHFDCYVVSFGIRNFTDIAGALCEAHRVLKPDGKFICLEFSKVNDYFLQKFYDFYSFKIIPKLGELVLNDRDSYQYLVESIRKFPEQKRFQEMIASAGFSNQSAQSLSFGTATINVGHKKQQP